MSATLSAAEFADLDQQVNRIERFHHHSQLLDRARSKNDHPAQLEHSLHICDTRLGMSKSFGERSYWVGLHQQVRELVDEAGYVWRGRHLVDPATLPATPTAEGPTAKAKSFGSSTQYADLDEHQPSDAPAPRAMAKSFGSSRAAEFQSLRSEILVSLAKARAERDSDSLRELCQLSHQLTEQAAAACLRLDHAMRYVPV